MTLYLSPLSSVLQMMSDKGIPLSGALLWTYAAGTSTPSPTFTDQTGTVQNGNPLVLNAFGRPPSVNIWQQGGIPLKFVFSTNTGAPNIPVFGVQIGPAFDNVSGLNDLTLANAALQNPASGSGADLVVNAERSYDVFATSRAANVPSLKTGQTLVVDFEGGVTVNDGLQGVFYWAAASTATDDGLKVIQPTGLATGRYLRMGPVAPFFAVKPVNTSIVSNTTPTVDPDLQIVIPAAGTWTIAGWLNDATGTSAGGLQGKIAYSGTMTSGFWASNGNGGGVLPVPLTSINTSAEMQSSQAGTASMPIEGTIKTTSGGTLSFNWAQHASNATATQLGTGSWLRLSQS